MSIALSVADEVARRIADEARGSDSINIVLYFERDHHKFYAYCWVYRHASSPADHVCVRLGCGGEWRTAFRVPNTFEHLHNVIAPPHTSKNLADLDFYFYAYSGGNPPPSTTNLKDIDKLQSIDSDYLNTEDDTTTKLHNFCHYAHLLLSA